MPSPLPPNITKPLIMGSSNATDSHGCGGVIHYSVVYVTPYYMTTECNKLPLITYEYKLVKHTIELGRQTSTNNDSFHTFCSM